MHVCMVDGWIDAWMDGCICVCVFLCMYFKASASDSFVTITLVN